MPVYLVRGLFCGWIVCGGFLACGWCNFTPPYSQLLTVNTLAMRATKDRKSGLMVHRPGPIQHNFFTTQRALQIAHAAHAVWWHPGAWPVVTAGLHDGIHTQLPRLRSVRGTHTVRRSMERNLPCAQTLRLMIPSVRVWLPVLNLHSEAAPAQSHLAYVTPPLRLRKVASIGHLAHPPIILTPIAMVPP